MDQHACWSDTQLLPHILQWHHCHLQVCAVTTERVSGRCRWSEIGGAPSCYVYELCLCSDLVAMGLLHCHLVARWTDMERLHNFSRVSQCWGLRNLMLPTTHRQLQSGGCCQTSNAVDLPCTTFAAFGQYRMRVPSEYRLIPDISRYHEVSPILDTNTVKRDKVTKKDKKMMQAQYKAYGILSNVRPAT